MCGKDPTAERLTAIEYELTELTLFFPYLRRPGPGAGQWPVIVLVQTSGWDGSRQMSIPCPAKDPSNDMSGF